MTTGYMGRLVRQYTDNLVRRGCLFDQAGMNENALTRPRRKR